MRKTFKYRIWPTKRQTTLLAQQLEDCRWLYNHWLNERKTSYEQTAKAPRLYDQQAELPALKLTRPGLNNVHSQVLQNVGVRLDLAMQAFFRRLKSGEKPGYPRFKGYGRYDSLTFPQAPSGCKLEGDSLIVSKVGHIKVKLHRPLKGTPKTVTLTRSSTGKWYVCFSCEGVEPNVLPPNPSQVGIDVGLKTFASMSDGQEIETPHFFRKEEKTLAKAQRKLSKAEKGTPERKAKRKIVARVHERIGWKRTNFSHQHSRKVINQFGLIAVEDLNVNRMLHNHCLAKSISDAAWSNFFSMLSCKAEEAGRTLIKVNPAYTSQTCSSCGHRQKMPLSERVFNCPCCLIQLDRDLNASLNILALGLQGLGVSPIDAPSFSYGE
jgi:putative transposase